MAKITITFEDTSDGKVKIVATGLDKFNKEASPEEYIYTATVAEQIALATMHDLYKIQKQMTELGSVFDGLVNKALEEMDDYIEDNEKPSKKEQESNFSSLVKVTETDLSDDELDALMDSLGDDEKKVMN